MHSRVKEKLVPPENIPTLIAAAEHYFRDIAALKKTIEEHEGKKQADGIAVFLACNYLNTMHAYLPPGHKEYEKLEAAALAMDLSEITPNNRTMARNHNQYLPKLPMPREMLRAAEAIRIDKLDVTNSAEVKSAVGYLVLNKFVPEGALNTSEEIEQFLRTGKLPPGEEWPDPISSVMFRCDCMRIGQISAIKNKNNDSPDLDLMRHIALLETEPDPLIHTTETLGMLQALKELGITAQNPTPKLRGMQALRYQCLETESGFEDAIHRHEPLSFNPMSKSNNKVASDSKIMQHYVDAMHREIKLGRIRRHLVVTAEEDVKTARQYDHVQGNVEPFKLRVGKRPDFSSRSH